MNNAAYLAGLIDGESCISVIRFKKRNRPRHYAGRIQISLTVKPVLDWVQKFTGVGTVVPRKSKQLNRKMAWLWVAESERAAKVLKLVLPFLKIKSKQAKNVLLFQTFIRKRNNGRPLSKLETTRREKCYRISRKLNGGKR
jgi:hypothetical protein